MGPFTRPLPTPVWVIAILAAIWIFLRYFEWRSIYFPSTKIELTPDTLGLDYEDIYFISEDGNMLHGWWIPHPHARGTIIHCHGNAGNIGDRLWVAADMSRLDVNVFLFDYRGYGKSKGLPTEKGTYADARAAYEVVREKYSDMNEPPVIVYGQSLGGAVAIQLALEKPVRGLIIESTFSSTIDMGHELYPYLPVKLLGNFRYDSLSKVGHLSMPKLFAHSRTDDLVPYKFGEKLFNAAADPKKFITLTGGHNEAGWSLSPEYWKAIDEFVSSVLTDK